MQDAAYVAMLLQEGRLLCFFQLEGVFDAGYFVGEKAVNLDALLHLRAAVNNGAVVAASHELANARGGHLGVFLGQIH